MKNARFLALVPAALLVVLALPVTALADPLVAEVENRGDALVFHPVVEFKELVLTVTGPCNFEYRQVARPGEAPFFRLNEETIDGTYTYSLVAMPEVSPEIIEILIRSRKIGDNSEVNRLCRAGRLPGDPATQSDGFRVFRREIVYDPGSIEKAAGSVDQALSALGGGVAGSPFNKDFVINDDLIVDGSACIGFDCVNGESFGFDTLRLKENNLRIKFDDTSTASSYPRNDWQLTANDSANGGASKFSIDDISGNRTPFTVEANARSHALYVDDGGRIGSRTSTPSVEIHTIDGDTPTLRLQQDGSSGFAPQTWDVAGNETNFFIRDVTNGSQLPFRIRPDAPSSSIFIDVDGDVGFGTSSPDAELHAVSGSGSFKVDVEANNANVMEALSSDGDNLFRVFETTAGDGLFSLYNNLGTETFRLTSVASGRMSIGCSSPEHDLDLHSVAGAACSAAGSRSFIDAGDTTFTASSARHLKENLTPLSEQGVLEKISGIPVYSYDFIEGPKDKIGLVAEDFHQIFGRGSDELLNGQEVQMALWLAVQELTTQNRDLQRRLAELEAALDDAEPIP